MKRIFEAHPSPTACARLDYAHPGYICLAPEGHDGATREGSFERLA